MQVAPPGRAAPPLFFRPHGLGVTDWIGGEMGSMAAAAFKHAPVIHARYTDGERSCLCCVAHAVWGRWTARAHPCMRGAPCPDVGPGPFFFLFCVLYALPPLPSAVSGANTYCGASALFVTAMPSLRTVLCCSASSCNVRMLAPHTSVCKCGGGWPRPPSCTRLCVLQPQNSIHLYSTPSGVSGWLWLTRMTSSRSSICVTRLLKASQLSGGRFLSLPVAPVTCSGAANVCGT